MTARLRSSHLLFLLAFLFPLIGSSQSAGAYEKAGDAAMKDENWSAAFYYYNDALLLKLQNPDLIFKCGRAAKNYGAYHHATSLFSKIMENEAWLKKYPHTPVLLGQVLKNIGDFEQAAALFAEYHESGCMSDSLCSLAISLEKSCLFAIEHSRDSASLRIVSPGKKINSPYADFAAFPVGDSLFFSSYKYSLKEDEENPPKMVAKTLLAKGKSIPRLLSRGFNSTTEHTVNFSQNKEGTKQYFCRCQFIGKVKFLCALYMREKKSATKWNKIERLPDNINLAGFSHTQPFSWLDEVKQREVLFFSSNKPGGKGGFDVWFTYPIDEKEWAEPQNLQTINTSGDEVSPFVYAQAATLFFSSDGHTEKNMGGFDIYKVKLDTTGIPTGDIQPLPVPINSSYHDYYYVLNADSTIAFFSSNRPGSLFLDPQNQTCCSDIYKVEFPVIIPSDLPEDTISTNTDEGLTSKKNIPDEPEVFDELEDFLPLSLYFHNDEPDPRSRKSITKKTYLQTYDAFSPLKNLYIDNFTKGMPADESEKASQSISLFFENKLERGAKLLLKFSDILLQRLQEGERIEVFLKGYTSPRANSDYNLFLSKRRISAVRNHFLSYKDGIFKEYLNKGYLLISEKPFGETEAALSVSDAYEDEKNSIFSVPASLERRVEIVEIHRD